VLTARLSTVQVRRNSFGSSPLRCQVMTPQQQALHEVFNLADYAPKH